MGYQGKERMRTKIVINGKTIEQVRDFNYLIIPMKKLKPLNTLDLY